MNKFRQRPFFSIIPWYYLIATIILYLGVMLFIDTEGITMLILTILWYPYLSYYLTLVSFYDNCLTIRRPLLIFYSKKIPYKKIDLVEMTIGKGTLIKIYYNENYTCTFSPPFLRKKEEKMLGLFESKGVKYRDLDQ